ncbi:MULTISPECIES: prohibitin family protein [unclassified Mucilaginibacter]|uniref:prohibitin family protein n=1 Tax=unclassified Mucilaginibacter TaxID=2617802 RepID=UPI002AC96205|nr:MULTISPECIES: prohibitin family protein [unclassified Mucilaginibacter]MEB0260916.1 prohibitin family protein [Mucilaginibacter sp. 10I4]MEB0279847.1 prohibitin family protein [Mucilaginibacter sp. 10B2]MEB0302805.1 prohibitin family protein [Mucilaginibacter sp. 5C4]WPX24182.1 prohibitin family protein [Mucilaginibacter sp. 5C4]
MFLIIVGIVVLIVGITIKRSAEPVNRFGGIISIIGIAIAGISLLFSVFKVIDPGKVGVQVLFGKVQNDVLESGLHVINPLVDVTIFNTQTQNYTMSAVHSEGEVQGDDAIRVLSSDGLEVTIDLTVLYKVNANKAPFIMQNIGMDYVDKIVRTVARTAIRDNAVNYAAVDLYSIKRQEFQNKINSTISLSFEKRGLDLQQILIRNISLPPSVKASIESKINAEQEAQKMTFVLQKERQEADRKRVEAQGIADYQKILSTGLSDKQLQYETIKAQKEIALSPNTKVIIIGGGKGNPIMLSDK